LQWRFYIIFIFSKQKVRKVALCSTGGLKMKNKKMSFKVPEGVAKDLLQY